MEEGGGTLTQEKLDDFNVVRTQQAEIADMIVRMTG
jgi:hypothetical protein